MTDLKTSENLRAHTHLALYQTSKRDTGTIGSDSQQRLISAPLESESKSAMTQPSLRHARFWLTYNGKPLMLSVLKQFTKILSHHVFSRLSVSICHGLECLT